ncbi:hypothetical protein DUNSADRAFT_5490 [Dunaliella salina]|uniref:Expansin-like EG45 domain-containing protein n=1 Tax=Dunaliella salina TaxID=3046 RepID=A0ABQ7H790_DUNSA|nr:hypothetical protein DUNSADRAFT_5490 [Dunaliella salina]|eukprot:KAF5842723.1 hypothetical protein DUNSADRAFT_5490 [Dunaliella salina]
MPQLECNIAVNWGEWFPWCFALSAHWFVQGHQHTTHSLVYLSPPHHAGAAGRFAAKMGGRSYVCHDESASVVVRSVDTCRCTYPPNEKSNRRWCCGDVDHLDLSKWAFEKLAELRWGVIKLEYRAVPCDHQPEKQAWIDNPSEGNPKNPPSDAKRRTRDWPELRSKNIVPKVIFNDGWIQNGFKDVSWSAWMQPLEQTKQSGMLGGPGMCASVNYGGALALKAWNGIFKQTVALEFWTYVGDTGYHGDRADIPDIQVSISGDKGGCNPVRVMSLKPIMFQHTCLTFGCKEEWWGYRAYLPAFAGSPPDTILNDPQWFNGCGGNEVWELNTVEFRHLPWRLGYTPYFCLDRVHLV